LISDFDAVFGLVWSIDWQALAFILWSPIGNANLKVFKYNPMPNLVVKK
jgi:hypothetical protein